MNLKYVVLDVGKRFVPMALRQWVRLHFSLKKFDAARRCVLDSATLSTGESFPGSKYKLGIIRECTHAHRHYVNACRELKVSYVVLDLLADDWVSRFKESDCDAYLVWPSSNGTMIKSGFDMRLKFLEDDMGKLIYPTWKDCWLTEYKPRLRDWMLMHNVPHPKSWVFYDEDEALEFCRTAPLPIVQKTPTGASGSGVNIIRSRSKLIKVVKQVMRKGIATRCFEPWDKQRGVLFLQEFLSGVKEWRMVRIGDSFFGYRKEVGEDGKGSGSHKWSWLDPGEKRLDMLKFVTDIENSRSMDVDLFELSDGTLLVNEYQTVFGCCTPAIQMKVNDVEGRYLHKDGKWIFESGEFSMNHCCNMRVKELIRQLDGRETQ